MAVPNSASITSERTLASLWQRAHALAEPVCLRTQDGRRLRVIYPGTASGRAGPDFRNAVIASDDGRIIRGDVELHLRAPDWYSHGHDVDPNYNGVVLHVVLQSKGETRSEQQSGLQTPVAEIAPLMELTEELPPPVLPSAEHVGEALDRAGDERFRLRSQGYAEEIRERDPAQTLYEAIMEALGYASNRPPFKRLASRVPISLLTELRDEPETSRRLALEAMLIRASGLMSLVEPEERARELRALSKHLPRVRPIPANKLAAVQDQAGKSSCEAYRRGRSPAEQAHGSRARARARRQYPLRLPRVPHRLADRSRVHRASKGRGHGGERGAALPACQRRGPGLGPSAREVLGYISSLPGVAGQRGDERDEAAPGDSKERDIGGQTPAGVDAPIQEYDPWDVGVIALGPGRRAVRARRSASSLGARPIRSHWARSMVAVD